MKAAETEGAEQAAFAESEEINATAIEQQEGAAILESEKTSHARSQA